MTNLLYVSASPRGDFSAAEAAASVFLESLSDSVNVNKVNLFVRNLPEVTLEITSAKMKFAMGAELTEEESRQWAGVINLVDEFKAADHYLLGVPMWNFSVPYKFKQYVDLLTHPGLTFTRDENGIRGLASGSATVIYSRGGDYSPKDGKPDPFDFQSPYMNAWLGLVGLNPVNEVLVQNTMAGPNGIANAVAAVTEQLQSLAREI